MPDGRFTGPGNFQKARRTRTGGKSALCKNCRNCSRHCGHPAGKAVIDVAEPILELRQIKKSFDDTPVLDGVSLSVERGEFLTILGPSGCGKTTTLRIIAGLTQPDEGTVLLSGRDVTGLPPEKRSVNTVFQNYALFPHMTVEKNIAYGLSLRRVPRAEQK